MASKEQTPASNLKSTSKRERRAWSEGSAFAGCSPSKVNIGYNKLLPNICKETLSLVSMVCGQFVIQCNSLESRALGLPHACLPQKPVLHAHTVIAAGCNR